MYNEGKLKDVAIYNPSMFDAVVIAECDDENVFGYYQYGEHDKKFFYVKLYHYPNTSLFYRNGICYDLNDFMKINMFNR